MSAVMKDLKQATPDIDVFSLPVHPDANRLPMLAEDEMADMVESIQANGQREPITIAEVDTDEDKQWMLIDGRNRREACRQAGIEPTYRIFPQSDEASIKAFIVDANNRRHNSKGQRAMWVAMMYPEPEKRGRGIKSSKNEEIRKVSSGNLSMARYVLKHDPESAKLVVAGHPNYALSTTYEKVKAAVEERKRQADLERQKLEQLTALRASYPDLASLVDEGRIYLDEALATAGTRAQKAREEAERQRQEEESRLAEAERQRREEERAQREIFEANRTGWFSQLYALLSAESIVYPDAQLQVADEYKDSWGLFYDRYRVSQQEALIRLHRLADHLPVLIQKIEAMRHE